MSSIFVSYVQVYTVCIDLIYREIDEINKENDIFSFSEPFHYISVRSVKVDYVYKTLTNGRITHFTFMTSEGCNS